MSNLFIRRRQGQRSEWITRIAVVLVLIGIVLAIWFSKGLVCFGHNCRRDLDKEQSKTETAGERQAAALRHANVTTESIASDSRMVDSAPVESKEVKGDLAKANVGGAENAGGGDSKGGGSTVEKVEGNAADSADEAVEADGKAYNVRHAGRGAESDRGKLRLRRHLAI